MPIIRNAIKGIVNAAAGTTENSKPIPEPTTQDPEWQSDPYSEPKIATPPQAHAPPSRGVKGKAVLAFSMLFDAKQRHLYAMSSTTRWAVTLIIVGIIFLSLCLAGQYPTSIAGQKALGIYAVDVTKYALYIVAGVMGVAGTTLSLRALRSNSSTTVPLLLLLISALIAVATIGMTIFVMTKGPQYDASWWNYLVAVFIIFQRVMYVTASYAAVRTLLDAKNDETVAKEVAASPLI